VEYKLQSKAGPISALWLCTASSTTGFWQITTSITLMQMITKGVCCGETWFTFCPLPNTSELCQNVYFKENWDIICKSSRERKLWLKELN